MRKGNKNVFIEGFKDLSSIASLNDILLIDLKGDGDFKLILFDKITSKLIVYKGVSRVMQKQVQIKNVSHMISFYDQDSRTPQPCIILGAQNAIYIFRNLQESFRLKIPDLIPDPQQQTAWSKHSQNFDELTKQLQKIQQTKKLTQYGKYFIGATTKQRKQELIKIAFEDGILQKDAISCISTIRQKDFISVQNVVVCTQLKQLHILDNFGHIILISLDLGFVGYQAFGEGNLFTNYTLIVVGRQQIVAIIKNGVILEKFTLPSRARCSTFDYPLLYVLTSNHTIISYDISDKHIKKQSIILPTDAIQIQAIRTRTFKALVVGFQQQIRVYNQNLLISKLELDHSLKCFKFGTSSRQQNCLVIMYQQHGFEVRIMHRQFNHNFKYQKVQLQKQEGQFPVPKITDIFASEMKPSQDDPLIHKLFQKDLKIMKWRTLTEQLNGSKNLNKVIDITSNIIGIGPHYILKLQLQNLGDQTIFNLNVCLSYNSKVLEIDQYQFNVPMLIPNFPYPLNIQCKNISKTGQASNIHVVATNTHLQKSNILISMPQSQLPI